MSLLDDLKNVYKVRTLIIAAVAFVVGQIVFHFLVLGPSREMASELERKLDLMTDTYVQLKATDMNSLIDKLDVEVKLIQNKEENIFANQLSQEQLPFFISNLEQTAEKAGLSVSSTVGHDQKPKNKEPRKATISLSMVGSYGEMLGFLNELKSWDNILLIKDFTIQNQNANDGSLSGQVQFVSLVADE